MTIEPPTQPSAPRRGTHSAQQLSDQEVTAQLQEELRALGNWMLGVVSAQPGWDRMLLDLKPQGGRTWVRISEERDGRVQPGTVGPLSGTSPMLRRIERLQSLSYRPGRGTWFATTIAVTAHGWPDPEHLFTARHLFHERPQALGEEGPYQLEDALEHLERFPRTEDMVPEWVGELAALQDQVIEVLPPQSRLEALGPDTVNPLLREAVLGFAAAPSDESMIEVLRQCLQGSVLLDVSGSDFVPGPDGQRMGPASTVRLQSFRESDGSVALAAYTSARDARSSYARAGGEGEPELLEQSATALLGLLAQDPQYDLLVLDPGTSSCRIPRRQVEWLMASAHNDVVKAGLVTGSVPQVLGGMVGRESQLLVATPAVAEGQPIRPVHAQPAGDGPADTLYVFTSAVEVAALDPALESRSASGRDILRFAVTSGARQICVNARPPMLTLQIDDVVELLDAIEAAAQAERAAGMAQAPDAGAEDESRRGELDLGDGAETGDDPGAMPEHPDFRSEDR